MDKTLSLALRVFLVTIQRSLFGRDAEKVAITRTCDILQRVAEGDMDPEDAANAIRAFVLALE